MAAVTGAVIAGAALADSAYNANKQAGAAKSAGNAAERANEAALANSKANYATTQTNLTPYINAGTTALGQMNAVNSGDYSGFENDPSYKFSLQQGLQGLDRSAAEKGSLYSGGHSADVLGYAQGLASQNLNSYYNRLSGLAGQGQNAATGLGSIGTGNAAQQGSYLQAGAAAQGQSAINQANVSNQFGQNTLSGLSQIAGSYNMNQPANASSYGSAGSLSGGLAGGTYSNGLAGWNATPANTGYLTGNYA